MIEVASASSKAETDASGKKRSQSPTYWKSFGSIAGSSIASPGSGFTKAVKLRVSPN